MNNTADNDNGKPVVFIDAGKAQASVIQERTAWASRYATAIIKRA